MEKISQITNPTVKKMMDNLVIAVLGNKNSGKSTTWNELFGETVRTRKKVRPLYLRAKEFVEVFLVSGSSKERQKRISQIIGKQRPRIILCSMQYDIEETKTIQFFVDNNYFLFCHWLNPGYYDNDVPSFDSLGLMNFLLSQNSIIGIRSGKTNARKRVREIKDYIYGWASSRNLIIIE